MADSENPTVPPPTWSFDSSFTRQEDMSAKATGRDSTNPTTPPQARSFHDGSSHETKASSEAPSKNPFTTASDHGAEPADAQSEHADAADTPPDAAPEQPNSRRYRTRTCRICLEDVPPSFEPVTASTQFLRQKPRVVYISEDPELGRLMRPCKCKGTQQYVHEGCLKAWRMARADDRNQWKCPTCLYEYRLNRLSWGATINSRVLRVVLTLSILLVTVFVLGFVADPILRYADPIGLISGYAFDVFDDNFDDVGMDEWLPAEPDSWYSHFSRGFLALGIVGMFKSVAFLRPWQIVRVAGGRRRGGGQDRLENVTWLLVVVGVATFLMVSCNRIDTVSLISSADNSPERMEGHTHMVCTRFGTFQRLDCRRWWAR